MGIRDRPWARVRTGGMDHQITATRSLWNGRIRFCVCQRNCPLPDHSGAVPHSAQRISRIDGIDRCGYALVGCAPAEDRVRLLVLGTAICVCWSVCQPRHLLPDTPG